MIAPHRVMNCTVGVNFFHPEYAKDGRPGRRCSLGKERMNESEDEREVAWGTASFFEHGKLLGLYFVSVLCSIPSSSQNAHFQRSTIGLNRPLQIRPFEAPGQLPWEPTLGTGKGRSAASNKVSRICRISPLFLFLTGLVFC